MLRAILIPVKIAPKINLQSKLYSSVERSFWTAMNCIFEAKEWESHVYYFFLQFQ